MLSNWTDKKIVVWLRVKKDILLSIIDHGDQFHPPSPEYSLTFFDSNERICLQRQVGKQEGEKLSTFLHIFDRPFSSDR